MTSIGIPGQSYQTKLTNQVITAYLESIALEFIMASIYKLGEVDS